MYISSLTSILSFPIFFFTQLVMILIKTADISNEARPMQVAELWLDCLLQEYFGQVGCMVLARLGHMVMLLN
jgi:hypothetical protein